jgi:UDP-N-acetylglucosamine acyltransferase
MATIDPTARVDPRAEVADDVAIGPFCVVGPGVRIGRGTRLLGHVHLSGATTLGESNTVGPFVAIGGDPQDSSYRGSPTRVEVGDRNVIREGVTIHLAGEKEGGVTRIGSHNVLMINSHVAHDCRIGDRITLGTGSMLAGHVHIEPHAAISDGVAVLQYVTIGGYSYAETRAKVGQDLPPFMRAAGNPAEVRRVRAGALGRLGLDRAEILAIREAYRLIYRAKVGLNRAAELLRAHDRPSPAVRRLLDFLEAKQRGKQGRARQS